MKLTNKNSKNVFKISIKECAADIAMILGNMNVDLLSGRREQIMAELNYSYKQLSFPQGDHPNFCLVETCQRP